MFPEADPRMRTLMDSERHALSAILFPGVQRLGITEMEAIFLMKLNICAAVAAGHFGNRFIVDRFAAAAEGPAPLNLCAGNRNGARQTP